jgi:hypothetical protein
LKATPKDDDTFLYDEKGCLFLLTADRLPACLMKACSGMTRLSLFHYSRGRLLYPPRLVSARV